MRLFLLKETLGDPSKYEVIDVADIPDLSGTYQVVLVSGTNIRTVNGTSLLGSGDISISGNLSDGDYGDVVVTGLGTVMTLDSTLTNATPGYFPVANVSGVLTAVPASGDVSLSNTGVFALIVDRWKLTGTSTPTGDMTVNGPYDLTLTLKRLIANNTFTTTANNQWLNEFSGTLTARATSNDVLAKVRIGGTIASGIAGQNAYQLYVDGTFVETNGTFTTKGLAYFIGTASQVLIDSQGRPRSSGGMSFDINSTAGANGLFYATGAGTIGFTTNGRLNITIGSITTQQVIGVNPTATFAPTSGAAGYDFFVNILTVNQTGSANGATVNTRITTAPTAVVGTHKQLIINTSATANPTGVWTCISVEPTVGTGTFYGIVVPSTSVLNGFGTATPTERVTVNGNLSLITAGSGVKIAEGSNATMGTATLSGGTVVVNTTKVTANSRIFLTVNGGTLTNVGTPYVSARTAATSFTITSTNASDASNVAWLIIEPN